MRLRILFVLLVFLCQIFKVANANQTLHLAVGERHPMTPLAAKILTKAYKELGIDILITELPGARVSRMLRAGLVDGELFRGPVPDKDLADVVCIPVPIAYGELMAFTTRDDIQLNGWDSLRNYHLGSLIRFEESMPGIAQLNIDFVSQPGSLLKMLDRERFDIAILPRRLGISLIAAMGLTNIHALEPPLSRDNLYHYLHIKNKHLAPKLTQVLEQMTESGELAAMKR